MAKDKKPPKNPHAQALVAARWKRTPPKERAEAARKAAVARWAKERQAAP